LRHCNSAHNPGASLHQRFTAEEPPVAKSQDHQKKQEKKKPEKTLKEKRQAKREKKAGK